MYFIVCLKHVCEGDLLVIMQEKLLLLYILLVVFMCTIKCIVNINTGNFKNKIKIKQK